MANPKISEDPRIDPRIKAIMGNVELPPAVDVENREELLAHANTPEAITARKDLTTFLAICDSEEIAPSAGLSISTLQFSSEPDANTVLIQ